MKCTRKSLDVVPIARKVQTFFDAGQMDRLARQTGFVQRSSRLTGLGLVQALVFGYLEHAHASLTQLASVCADLTIEISPQGLDARLQAASVRFLQAVLAQALRVFQSHLPLPLAILAQFSAVYIVDSSVQALPAALQADYPGCGGGGPVASLKIQLVFDFLCGNLRQIALQAGRSADQAYHDYLALLQPGCLILADLGYFCLDAWQAIGACPAFFLSRYLYPTALFGADGERLEAPALLQTIHAAHFEREVQLGRRQRLACRLIAIRVPAAVAEQRRRKAREKARQNGKGVTQAYLGMLAWSLFVTNVPGDRLTWQQVALLYRVRWQIELLFNLWKSYAGWKAIGAWRRERIFSELYAKMIGMVLFSFLVAPVRIPDEHWEEAEISLVQAYRLLTRFATRLLQHLTEEAGFARLLQQVLEQWVRLARKQKRRKRPNVCQRLAQALA